MKRLLVIAAVFVATALRATNSSPPVLRIELTSPVNYQIVQRSSLAEGRLVVTGRLLNRNQNLLQPDDLEVRITGKPSFGHLSQEWQVLPCELHDGKFQCVLNLAAGGWYRFELRVLGRGVVLASVVIEHVGVGEIFVVTGQSNSANHGEERQSTETGRVAAFDGTNWCLANDPIPGATGSKGSFMPPFGDEIAQRFHVPIGIVALGIGATSVREWMPADTSLVCPPTRTNNVFKTGENEWKSSGKIYDHFVSRLKSLGINGFRAVLWHQGESDAHQSDPSRTLPGEYYREYLEKLINDSRESIGWKASWFVAQATYHSPDDPGSPDIRAAQKAVWDDQVASPGPDTDTLKGEMREKNGQGVHFSGLGLKAHAHLWSEKVGPWLEQKLRSPDNP